MAQSKVLEFTHENSMVDLSIATSNDQRVNTIKSHETTIFRWFSYGLPEGYHHWCSQDLQTFISHVDGEELDLHSIESWLKQASLYCMGFKSPKDEGWCNPPTNHQPREVCNTAHRNLEIFTSYVLSLIQQKTNTLSTHWKRIPSTSSGPRHFL